MEQQEFKWSDPEGGSTPAGEASSSRGRGRLHIYGAGMAGLLAGHMLRRFRPVLHEQQAALPDNHGALLRFRSSSVAQETGQPFQKVRVMKAIKCGAQLNAISTLADANRYSHKVTRHIRTRSAIDLAPCERYIAPPNFLGELAAGLSQAITFGDPLTLERLSAHVANGDSVISTIPMPVLMQLIQWERMPQFAWLSVWSVTMKLASNTVDVYQTIYYPGEEPYYRASITGDRLIIECLDEPSCPESLVAPVLEDFGIRCETSAPSIKRQEYGKLVDSAEERDARQEFIIAMTDQYRIYSVGRFATWRQILLDDVASDIHKVSRWIDQRTNYQRRRDA